MISEERIRSAFLELAAIDSESYREKAIGKAVTARLRALGLEVITEGTTGRGFLNLHPDSHPNILARLKGTAPGDPVLFSAHLDTVSPGTNKEPVVVEDGTIRSAGETVLGADDLCGIVSILEALRVIREENLPHPDIEVLITPAEEPFCEGSRYLDFRQIRSRTGYVLDLTGPIGTAAVSAPTIVSFEAVVRGRAAHAGFNPEEGINALNITVKTLAEIRTGRLDGNTTVNVGTIQGGTGNNIVPERVRVTGEVRSLVHSEADRIVREILDRFSENARKAGGIAYCSSTERIRAYRVEAEDPAVRRFRAGCEAEKIPSRLVDTLGGSDANRLNEAGISAIVTACGMENVHSTEETTNIKDLIQSARLTLRLMTLKEEQSL